MRLLYEKIPFQVAESIHAVDWSWPQVICPYHYHAEVELVWVRKSKGRMSIGDYQGSFKEGDLFLIGSNVPHVFYNTDEHRSVPGASRIAVVQFSENFLGEAAWRIPELVDLGKTVRLARRGMKFNGSSRSEITAKMTRLLSQSGASRVTLLLEILSEWADESNYRCLRDLSEGDPFFSGNDRRIQKILKHLSGTFQERVTLAELAKQVAMTSTSLSRLVRQKMGISLVDYINTQRIALACQLLAGTDRTISEICYEIGFENVSNFNRQFSKRKQCTPKEFRGFYRSGPAKMRGRLPDHFAAQKKGTSEGSPIFH